MTATSRGTGFLLHVIQPGEGDPSTPFPTTPPDGPVSTQIAMSFPAVVDAGATTPVLVGVVTPESRPALELYAVRGGKLVLLASGRADARGLWRTSVRSVHDETLVAMYGGRFPDYFPAEVRKDIGVRAVVRTALIRPLRTRRGVGVYRASKPLTMRASVAPSHRGDCVFFRTQVRRGARWVRTLSSDCFKLDRRSGFDVAIRLPGVRPGVVARVQAGFGGDDQNHAGVSPWRQVRFVR